MVSEIGEIFEPSRNDDKNTFQVGSCIVSSTKRIQLTALVLSPPPSMENFTLGSPDPNMKKQVVALGGRGVARWLHTSIDCQSPKLCRFTICPPQILGSLVGNFLVSNFGVKLWWEICLFTFFLVAKFGVQSVPRRFGILPRSGELVFQLLQSETYRSGFRHGRGVCVELCGVSLEMDIRGSRLVL